MKVCKICEVEKPLTEFYKSKTHKQGVTNYCKRCTCEIRKKDREENRDKYIEKDRRYFEANTEKVRARSRDYHRRHAAKRNAQRAQLYLENKEHSDAVKKRCRERKIEQYRAYQREYHLKRAAEDVEYKLNRQMRDSVVRTIRFLQQDKEGSTKELLGYSPEQLKQHLEAQFQDGMSWENYGDWHIDHIVPISKLVADGETDPAVINALENLQPLWAAENLAKGAKLPEAIDSPG